MCWFMLGSAGFSVCCHTGGAHKFKIRLSCVLNTALDLAAAAFLIGWRVGGKLRGGNIVSKLWHEAGAIGCGL